jgi:hypothetical protein
MFFACARRESYAKPSANAYDHAEISIRENESERYRMADMERTAIISACGAYRYQLTRRWGPGPAVVWIMLNPSTADATIDDQTITKCVGFTKRAGYAALVVVNLFAFRSRWPADMKAAPDPVGPDNDAHIAAVAKAGAMTICAWGNNGDHLARDKAVVAWLRANGVVPHALTVTSRGQPGHPVLLGYSKTPQPFAPDQ